MSVSLHYFFLVFRARYKLMLIAALATIAVVMLVSSFLTKRYIAETSLIVDVKSPDPVSAVLLPALNLPGNMSTQVEIISSDRVTRKVIRSLKLDESEAVRQQWLISTGGSGKLLDWLAKQLPSGLKATPSRDSNVINITFTGTDPSFTAAVANAYAQSYIEASIELRVEPARQYSRWFGEQAKVLRENVEKAQTKLSEYQREKGIVNADEKLDYEVQKLNDLSARLTGIQSENRDSQSKQRSGSSTMETLPEVQQSAVVTTLRANVAQLEVKLKEAAGNLGSNHPQYKRMEAELTEMKHRLEAEMLLVASSFSSTSAVGKKREAELLAAIEVQKKKLLQLKNGRDEIAVLVRDIETAKRSYEAVTNRFTQTSLESQATQTNISVLSQAVVPLEPSFPKPLHTMFLLSILAGVLLSGILVYAIEMLDRRIRSVDDLAEMLQIPVLGTITRAGRPIRLGFSHARPALAGK